MRVINHLTCEPEDKIIAHIAVYETINAFRSAERNALKYESGFVSARVNGGANGKVFDTGAKGTA